MSLTKRVEKLVKNIKQDQTTQKFQQQYSELIKLGVIQRKGYNLADVNVIGDKSPSTVNNYLFGVSISSID